EKMADIRASWPKIEAELSEQQERLSHVDEAAAESSLTGQLRQAVHHSGLQVPQIASAAGIAPEALCDWLEGLQTLRSDVLDRITQAIGASTHFSLQPKPAKTR
ncbi:MAG TPA: hypothetical protein VK137_05095, partial [Planctomycetaceae bacterium]|nr:hypothetical protein [Planctomycetaceae bacterium]